MAFSSTPSLVRTRMDTGTARTTWETRGTHTLRLSRKCCCMSTCPHCCGLITPSRCLGSDLRNPGPHMSSALPHHATKVRSPQTDTNAHIHHAYRRARKGTRAQQGQKGLHMASRHGLIMHSACDRARQSPRQLCSPTESRSVMRRSRQSSRRLRSSAARPPLRGQSWWSRASMPKRLSAVRSAIAAPVVGCGSAARFRTTNLRCK